jgi:signal transduction histidine kinase
VTVPTQRRVLHVLALCIGVLTLVCVVDSIEWINRPFMGFLLGRNRIVAPIGLAHWSGFRADVPFGSELVAADDQPVGRVADLVERTWARHVGTPVRYTFATPGGRVERTVPVMRFTLADHLSLFGVWLLNGAIFVALGLIVAYLKPGRPASIAMLVFCTAWGLTLLLSLGDFYRFHFRSLYAVAQATAPAALLVLGATFPDRPLPARGGLLLTGLALVTALHAGLDIALYDRAAALWMRFFEASLVYMGAAALGACALIAVWYRRADADDRLRVQVVAAGSLLAFGLPAAVHLGSTAAGVPLPVNLLPVVTAIFPVVVTYAILKRDFLDLEPLLTRSVFYAVFSTAVVLGYVALLGAAHALGPGVPPGLSAWMPFLFTLAVVAAVAPIRRGVQALVDRVFFRTRYDRESTVVAVSERLTTSLDRAAIVDEIRRTLDDTIGPEPCFIVLPNGSGPLRGEGGALVPLDDPILAAVPGPGAAVAPLAAEASRGARALAAAGGKLIVSLRVRDDLEGLLVVGAKRSGAPYGGHDLLLLRTLANQTAIALRNAASYAALRELTATLEERVAKRTVELARRDAALLDAQSELARADKLAALGRLVAGIAHEINNPVAFINSSVDLIHTAAVELREGLDGNDGEMAERLEQLLQNTRICRDSAARAARVVRELTAFARAPRDGCEPTDLHAGLERALQLLRGQCRDRITVRRMYGSIPQVVCNAGQIDQVFLNLLTNAVQAVEGEGEIRLHTYAENGSVFVEVSDSGPGIAPEIQARLFEPFFTTKPIGQGTGLGLAIAHSLVGRHGGEIQVRSTAGAGATFTVRLPLEPSAGT